MAKTALDELIERIDSTPDAERRQKYQDIKDSTQELIWVPNPGQQSEAYLSDADIMLYGGQAGGGKSNLVLGWGVNEAQTGIIFRRELAQTDGLEADGKVIVGNRARWNGQDREWTWPSKKTLKLGGMKDADSWMDHAGRERDFIAFDEAGEFLEMQVAALFAWLRSPVGKRTRLILGSNPPRTADGYWMVDWFAPWLDEKHELFPAEPGQLLWAIYVSAIGGGGKTLWVEGPGTFEVEGEHYTSMSRTFIPASLKDNPYRNTSEYRAKLQSLPEPLRSQLLKGDFRAGLQDQANQVIPTSWVRAAQARWNPNPPKDIPMCAIGVDPAAGGEDQMCLAPRHDAWFANLIKIPGKEIPIEKHGSHSAGLILSHRRDGAIPIIDMGGGYGAATYSHLRDNDIQCMGYKGAESTTKRTKDKKLGFTNTRSAAYWLIREALDPDQSGGSVMCLPSDKRLLAGLCAPTFEVTPRGIQVEAKSKREGGKKGVVERLGWSPDEADSVVMGWWGGAKMSTHALDWIDRKNSNQGRGLSGMQPKVVLGHPSAKRRYR